MSNPQGYLIVGALGTIAQQPSAAHLPDGFRYVQTDGVEQYVDGGTWVDVPNTGSGGTIEDITSTGASVDVTGPTGPTTNLEVSTIWLAAHAVTSLDGTGGPLEGDITLSEGANITLAQVGQNIEIASTGGGSGITAWGQVSTAEYSGAGSPVGVVTPDAEGDLYVDTTTPALWQATGVTSADWQMIGTGSAAVSVANFGATFQSLYNPGGTVLDALGPTLTTPVDPVAFQYGAVNIPVALPLFTYPPGAIAVFGGWNVNQVDTTNDPYDIRVAIIISDATGTNSLVLQGFATANAGTPGDAATINPADLTVTNLVGTDLSYDIGTGEITSAAGGVYWIQAIWNGDWD